MKLFLKGLCLSLLAGLTFVACDEDDNYSAGEQYANGVVIASASNVSLSLDESSFDIVLQREDAGASITVPLSFEKSADVFDFPQSVTFEAGQTEASVTVTLLDNAKLFKNYVLSLVLPGEFANVYSSEVYRSFKVMKHDFKPKYNGQFYSWFFAETDDEPAAFDAVMEYSELSDTYRLCVYEEDYYFNFKLGDEKLGENAIVMTDEAFESGVLYPPYGMVSLNYSTPEAFYFDPEEKAFVFNFEFTVSAGSFGEMEEVFVITE